MLDPCPRNEKNFEAETGWDREYVRAATMLFGVVPKILDMTKRSVYAEQRTTWNNVLVLQQETMQKFRSSEVFGGK